MSEITVRGLAELQRFLDKLPARLEQNAMRGALRAGAVLIRDEARGQVSRDSGALAESLRVSARARAGVVRASVVTRVFYARFVEYGTRPHRIEPKNRKSLSIGGLVFASVDHPGARPHPFLRPALDARAGAAVLAAGEYLKARLAEKHGLDTSDVQLEAEG